MSDGGTQKEREIDGGDRITQGLGTVWSLILGRPSARMSCLDIALKVAFLLFSEEWLGIDIDLFIILITL